MNVDSTLDVLDNRPGLAIIHLSFGIALHRLPVPWVCEVVCASEDSVAGIKGLQSVHRSGWAEGEGYESAKSGNPRTAGGAGAVAG